MAGQEEGISLGEALKAQQALRAAGKMPAERFPVEAFVGMISDEVEELRRLGHTDDQIAEVVTAHSEIAITGAEIARYYATPEERLRHSD